MRKVAFFVSKFEVDDTNYSWIANELLRRGISVSLLLIDTLSLHKSQINASGWKLAGAPQAQRPQAGARFGLTTRHAGVAGA